MKILYTSDIHAHDTHLFTMLSAAENLPQISDVNLDDPLEIPFTEPLILNDETVCLMI